MVLDYVKQYISVGNTIFLHYRIIWFLIGKTMYFFHLAISTRFGVIDSFFVYFCLGLLLFFSVGPTSCQKWSEKELA